MNRPKLRTKFDGKSVTLETGSESHVQQHLKDQCDINTIMAKYRRTGTLPNLIKQNPVYGDFSNVPDYQEALHIVHKAEEQFAGLPAHLRERFGNNPSAFLAFTGDPANREEMATLGLLKEGAVKPKGTASNDKGEGKPEVGSKDKKKPAPTELEG